LASVLGRSFDRGLLDQLLAVEEVEVGGDAFDELRTQLLPDADGERIRFRHALLQEAAYQSLPFRQRLGLHRTVGETIERNAPEIDAAAPMLSLHFLAAQDWERTWRYARVAAGVAQGTHALGEVAVHLERAVTAARRLVMKEGEELTAVFNHLGHTLELLGVYERADDAYRRAAAAAGPDPLQRGEIAYRRAYVRSEYLGRPSTAIRLLRAARTELNGADAKTKGLHALLLAAEADVRQRQGRPGEAIKCGRRAAHEAERVGDKRALARALQALNIGLVKAGRADEVDFMDQALALYRELGDEVGVADALANIATVAFFASEWERAAHYVSLSADASAKAGDLAGAAMAHGNLGELRTNQGRLDEAVALLTPARRTLESFGYLGLTAAVAAQLGRTRAFLGDVDDGVTIIREATATLDEIGSHYELLEARARLAEVLAFAGRFAEAWAALRHARELEHEVGDTPLTALIDRIELTLDVVTGDRPIDGADVERFLERARAFDATYEELVVLAVMEHSGDVTRQDQMARLTRDLGVVRLPMLQPV
jgi:tetratricopeptide (TPR) repeat protein